MTKSAAIIVVSLLLFSSLSLIRGSTPRTDTAICIEHIGESDKPIFPIVVATSAAGVKLCKEELHNWLPMIIISPNIVSRNLMSRLVFEISRFTGTGEGDSPFGTFKITVFTAEGRNVVVVHKAEMLGLVERLKAHCEDNPKLGKDLLNLEERLRP